MVMLMVMVVVLVMRVASDSGVGGIRWSDDMIYQCSEVPGNISRENQTCCDSTAVFRSPGGAMVRLMGGPQPSSVRMSC